MGLRSLPGSALQPLSLQVRGPGSDGARRGRLAAQEEPVPRRKSCAGSEEGAWQPAHCAVLPSSTALHGELPARAISITLCNNAGRQL